MKLGIEIKNGSLDLAASGMVIIDSANPTEFTIIDNGDPVVIVMKFKNDESSQGKMAKNIKPIGERTLEIEFINYNSILGSYTKEPWSLGNSYGRELFMTYVISGFEANNNMKRIQYSFFLGKEISNG